MQFKISLPAKEHNIYISSKVTLGAFSKSSDGFHWDCNQKNYFFTERVVEILIGPELEIRAFYNFLQTLIELRKDEDHDNFKDNIFNVFFKREDILNAIIKPLVLNGVSQKLLFDIRILTEYLLRMDISFSYQLGTSEKLENKIIAAMDYHKLFNDFQTKTKFLSCVSSDKFDDFMFAIVDDNIIEYVSPSESGIPGPYKRLITPDDESCLNATAIEFKPNAFPPKSGYETSKIRRSIMTVRDSDLALIITPFDGSSFISPDEYFILASNFYDVPIFILDSQDQKWYTKSISNRRDYVRAKQLPEISNYKNIAVYGNPSNLEKSWRVFRKTFWN